MQIDAEKRHRIGYALNEASLLGVEFNKEKKEVACTFSVIAMDKYGNVPNDNRLLFIFKPVGRFVASLRNGHWDDDEAEVETIKPDYINEIIQSFRCLPIYGWDFVNCGDQDFDTWKDRLSFDCYTGDNTGLENTIDLFQEGGNRHLDLRIWFNDIEIYSPDHKPVEFEDFLENGKRGWEAIYADNEKVNHFGIIPDTHKNQSKIESIFKRMAAERRPRSWLRKLKNIIINK